jgi:hypothetical protein
MDATKAVLADIWDTLTGDATLTALLGGTPLQLFRDEANENPTSPYCVHALNWNSDGGDDWAVCDGPEYTLDTFCEGETPDKADAIADRIIKILEGRQATTPEGDAHYTLSFFNAASIPTGSHTEWQRSLIFWIYAFAVGQIGAVV